MTSFILDDFNADMGKKIVFISVCRCFIHFYLLLYRFKTTLSIAFPLSNNEEDIIIGSDM